ncbi:oligosaccharide repeat unit polymerase [Bacteriovoracaceae bacterium]|nr:oligosaccharide repeat unit polymerase [Bacteriovoracaceae bacterium]
MTILQIISMGFIIGFLLIYLYVYIRFDKKITLPIILCMWWILWLAIANYSLTGVTVPSLHTQLLVYLMATGFLLGNIGAIIFYSKNLAPKPNRQTIGHLKIGLKFVQVSNAIISPIVIFFLILSIYLLTKHNINDYRVLVFSTKTHPSILFHSGKIELLYSLIISPILLTNLFIIFANLRSYRSHKWVFISTITLNVFDAVMRLGRFNMYFMIILFLSSLYISYLDGFRKKLKFIPFILLLGFIIFQVGSIRNSKDTTLKNQVSTYLIDYHTMGFAIFDSKLTNPNSRLNHTISWGRGVIGGIDQLIGLVARKIGFQNYITPVQETALKMTQATNIGTNLNGSPKKYNAFYTVLYTLYLDGREFFVFLVPFLFGTLFMKYYHYWTISKSPVHLSILLSFIYVVIFSIFQSPIETPIFWISLIYLNSLGTKFRNGHFFHNLIQYTPLYKK